MKIAIVLPTIISKSGTAKQSVELAKVLLKRGHLIEFFTFAYHKSWSFPEFNNFKIYCCVEVEKSLIYKLTKNVSSLEKIYLYLALFRIKSFRDLFAGKTFDILNPHDWLTIWAVVGLKDKPCIVANINDVPNRVNGCILDRLKLSIDRRFAKNLNHVVVLDYNNKNKLIDWISLNSNQVSVVRSGIDIEKYKNFERRFDIRGFLGVSEESRILVCANLLAPNRRYEDVILALAKLKDVTPPLHLIILSKLNFNVQYGNFLKNLIEENSLSARVHFIDKFFTDEERMMFIANSDILVFPNSPQTWGLTVIEAMALGVPVVVSTGAGVTEVLTNDVNAIIYQARNVGELTDKLLFCRNVIKLKEIATNGREFVLGNFSWEIFGTQIEKIMSNSICSYVQN